VWKVSSFHKKSQALSNKSAPSSARLFMQYYASTLITLPLSTSAKKKHLNQVRRSAATCLLLVLPSSARCSTDDFRLSSPLVVLDVGFMECHRESPSFGGPAEKPETNHTAARSRHGLRDQLDAEELQSTVKELSDLTLTAIDSHSAEEMPSTDTLLRGCQKVLEFWTYSQTFRGISQTSQWP